MSGLEVAGLVSGSLPLVISALEYYAEGIQGAKRYWKYKVEMRSLRLQFEVELAIFVNTLEQLLVGVLSSEQMATFLSNPGDKTWKDAETNLKPRLGQNYELFCETVLEMNQTLVKVMKKLALDPNGKACKILPAIIQILISLQPQFSDLSLFKQEYKRLKFSISKSEYTRELDRLRFNNQSLSRLAKFSHEPERSTALAIQFRPDFQVQQSSAHVLYDTIRAGFQCSWEDFTINLRLEKWEFSTQDRDDPLESTTFRVVFFDNPKTGSAPKIGKELNFQWLPDSSTPAETLSSRQNSYSVAKPSRRVRFDQSSSGQIGMSLSKYVDTNPVSASMETSLTQEKAAPEPALVQDLWQSLGDPEEQQGDNCIGYLLGSNNRKLGIYSVSVMTNLNESQQQDWSAFSLRQVLSKTKVDNFRLTQSHKFKIAAALAWGVLRFSNTPWLSDDWNEDDIYFIHRPGASRTATYDYPFLHREFSSTVATQRTLKQPIFYKLIRNEILFTLGIVLIELLHGKLIEELQVPGDIDSQGTPGTVWRTAERLIEELEYEVGARYYDAVRRCIRGDFNCKTSSLADPDFQQAVFDGVVMPLEQNFQFFQGLDNEQST